MSVIVKGVEMPQNCKTCPFSDHEAWCLIPGDWRERYYCPDDERSEYCPLIELPPHGRMIDADEPMAKISTMMQEPDYQHEGEGWMVGLIMARDAIDEAPTVIEAEGET